MIKLALSIVFLIPGLIIGSAFKGLAYLSANVQENHRLIQEHLTPVNREIGTVSNPIKTRNELFKALEAEYKSDSKNRPTNALIIHGDGTLTINEDPGILRFNPMKLILEGARIVHQPSAIGRLDDQMYDTRKWQVSAVRTVNASNVDDAAEGSHKVESIDDALIASAPRRSWTSLKRYHMIFTLARPQAV